MTWIDLNVPYYGSYTSIFPDNPYGRAPISGGNLGRLAQLAGCGADRFKHAPELQMSFVRPEQSPLVATLGGTDDPRAVQALEIIRGGAATLKNLPREDQLGAAAGPRHPQDVERAARYARWRADEQASRRAVVEGKKHYPDAGFRPAAAAGVINPAK